MLPFSHYADVFCEEWNVFQGGFFARGFTRPRERAPGRVHSRCSRSSIRPRALACLPTPLVRRTVQFCRFSVRLCSLLTGHHVAIHSWYSTVTLFARL